MKESREQAPQNLVQLIKMIIKGMITNIPKRLLYASIIGGVTFLVHTYLVIYPNGGYWPGTSPTLDNILTLVGNKTRGTIFWSIALYLLTSTFMRIKAVGAGVFFSGIANGPARVLKSARDSASLKFFAASNAIMLIVAQHIIANTAISWTLLIGAVLATITYKSSLSYLVLRLGYQDISGAIKKGKGFKESYFDAYQMAVVVSMLLFIVLPAKPYSTYGAVLLSVLLLFYEKLKKSRGVASNVMMFGLLGLSVFVMAMKKVYADDGGVEEAGGFIPWITSPGALTAVTVGLPSAIGAAIGGLIGIVTAPIVGISDYVESGEMAEDIGEFVDDTVDYVEDIAEDIEEFTDQAVEGTQKFTDDMVKDIQEAVEGAGDYIDELSEELEDYISDSLSDDEYDVLDVLSDIYDSQFGGIEDRVKSVVSLTKSLPPYIGDLINSTQDYVLTSNAIDAICDTFDNMVPDWFVNGAADTANEFWDYMGATKNVLDLADMIPEGNAVSDFMGHAGILKDALDNWGLGDNPVYAGMKSFISNKVKDFIFDKNKNPGLIVMDTLTTIFAGGTEAGEIISPGKTIQGGTNFIIDKVTDIWNGTDDVKKRLQNGNYGGVWKVADDTTDLMADAVYNTKQFSSDFVDVVTSDEFYDGMYDTNKQLWKPKEGSWAIKRAGCYVGEKTCEGFIKIADGVHELSKWLGGLM